MHRIRLPPQCSLTARSVLFTQRRTLLPSLLSYRGSGDKALSYQLYSRRNSTDCPKCNAPLTTSLPTCSKCGHIAPVDGELKEDYFSLFRLPSLRAAQDAAGTPVEARNVFSVDPQELRRRFLQMQKLCHPDRWAQKGEEAAETAASQSSLINKAYQTLLSPRTRGEYILSQQGVDILEADNMDEEQDLMLEVMEAREELENAEGEEVKELLEINRQRIEKATMELQNAIGYEDWEDAKRAVIRLRYWESFQRAGKGQELDH